MHDTESMADRRERGRQARRERHIRTVAANQRLPDIWREMLTRDTRVMQRPGDPVEWHWGHRIPIFPDQRGSDEGAMAGDPLWVAAEEHAQATGTAVTHFERVSEREARFRVAGAERWRSVTFVTKADGGIEVRCRDEGAPVQ